MDRTSDGRKAWITLKAFYEGEDFLQRIQDESFAILANTSYRGESQRFNFERYVARHLKAHKLLVEADYNHGMGMDESTKIQHLKAGIRVEAGLEHAITTACTTGLFVSFLSAEVEQRKIRKRELKSSANISAVAGDEDHKRSAMPRSRSGDHHNQNKTSEVVDGVRVYGKF
jgi:hypothetical protein